MCIKGLKGRDYTKIVNWYKLIFDNITLFVDLLQIELDQFKNTLDVLKCGFYSHSSKVVSKCSQVFTKIVQAYNEGTPALNDMKFEFLDWLVNQQNGKDRLPPSGASPSKNNQKKLLKKKDELGTFLGEPGIKTYLRAYRKH